MQKHLLQSIEDYQRWDEHFSSSGDYIFRWFQEPPKVFPCLLIAFKESPKVFPCLLIAFKESYFNNQDCMNLELVFPSDFDV